MGRSFPENTRKGMCRVFKTVHEVEFEIKINSKQSKRMEIKLVTLETQKLNSTSRNVKYVSRHRPIRQTARETRPAMSVCRQN